jgi:HEAT repeat protein
MVKGAVEGKRFKIQPEDYPEIAQLLEEDRVEYRQAGVLLAIQADNSFFTPLIVRAALDSDERVSVPASEEIEANPIEYRQAILNLLDEENPQLRIGGIQLLTRIGGADVVGILIGLFNDPDPDVRNQASLSVWAITDRNNAELRAALRSTDQTTAAVAYRTLGRYTDPADTPLFIEAFGSPNPEVRKEAQLAVLRLGPAGLPFLHTEAGDPARPYRTRISSLEVVQGIKSTESIPLLLRLLSDPDGRIREKSASILGTYGAEAVSTLAREYQVSSDDDKIRIIRLMGDIRSPAAFPTLIEALDSPSDEIRIAAMNTFRLFGPDARETIWKSFVSGTPRTRSAGIILLREQADPWLVTLDNGSPNQEALVLLITLSGRGQIAAYLEAAKVSRLWSETILALKDAWDVSDEFVRLEKTMSSGSQPYLRTWRQWKSYALASRQALERSFDEIHVYFETRDLNALETARVTRAESRRLNSLAQTQKNLLDGMSDQVKEDGEESLAMYRETREILVRTWETVVPELKGIAAAVYESRGLNPERLAREAVLLE